MNKKLFVFLVVLMSISLIGIILVQSFFINKSLQNEEKNFIRSVKIALTFVSKDIEDFEVRNLHAKIQPYISQGREPDSTFIRQLYITTEDDVNEKFIVHRNTVLEEQFKVPSTFFEIDTNTILISNFTNERKTDVYNTTSIDAKKSVKPEHTSVTYSSMNELEKRMYTESFREYLSMIPIFRRINTELVRKFLTDKLRSEGVNIEFDFAIYDGNLPTKIYTSSFIKNPDTTLGIPVFLDNNNQSPYTLYVNFPDRRTYLLSSVFWMIVLSLIFTGIIIIAYSSSIHQLIKQRKISQIKTDFINNMTHEFKTPIATINLALDAIKNPKIIKEEKQIMRYLKMIKDENKRMHEQVNNVLRISKLEKNELNISKVRLELHDLIEDAITHVQLIIENRKGYIKTRFNAEKSAILANETHFTNVIVNILDNAIKYSDNHPKIDVSTENTGNYISLKIKDHGKGISKQVIKRIFEKFYREHAGNVHNVKGHGLGLAYVKRIVDDHQGYISVESEKGKGSTFTIKLPIIS